MIKGEIRVSVCGRTHKGRVRKENQDSFFFADLGHGGDDHASANGTSIGPHQVALGDKGIVLLVADGMGGRAGGAKASSMAVTAVRNAMTNGASQEGRSADAFALGLRHALDAANEEIHEHSRRDDSLRGMGTTATLAGLHASAVYLAQVGDSRAYLVRGDALARVTRDQSLVQDLIDSGVVNEQEARNVRDNRILQALGTSPSVTPVLTWHDLRRGDVLLLCSDGLCRVVDDAEIFEVVKGASDCLALCDQLISLANARGGPDNITVLVARVDGDGLEKAEGSDRVALRAYEPSAG
jgi:serine/threonine protein phosphatase PrpC